MWRIRRISQARGWISTCTLANFPVDIHLWQSGGMPSQHRYRAAIYRADPDLRRRVRLAVEQVDSNVNNHIVEFFRWLVHDVDELPSRPAEPVPPSGAVDSAPQVGRLEVAPALEDRSEGPAPRP